LSQELVVLCQVSDGIETSPAAFLRISAFPLQLRLVNNTGLILTHRTAAHITTANLTFASNAEDADLDVRYEVVKPPQFGAVQRLRGGASDSQWQTVEHFTSHQLARDQIRYLHMSGDPTHDSFKVGYYISKAGNLLDIEIAANFTNRFFSSFSVNAKTVL